VSERVIVGALAVVALAVIFGGPTARWVGRLGESPAEAKVRKYKEARHELADPATARREQSSVEAELTAHERDLLEAGYWEKAHRNEGAKALPQDKRRETKDLLEEEGSDPRLSIRERREQLRKRDRTDQTEE
jgi:hypothetical protein